jgi:hypothetical protein
VHGRGRQQHDAQGSCPAERQENDHQDRQTEIAIGQVNTSTRIQRWQDRQAAHSLQQCSKNDENPREPPEERVLG